MADKKKDVPAQQTFDPNLLTLVSKMVSGPNDQGGGATNPFLADLVKSQAGQDTGQDTGQQVGQPTLQQAGQDTNNTGVGGFMNKLSKEGGDEQRHGFLNQLLRGIGYSLPVIGGIAQTVNKIQNSDLTKEAGNWAARAASGEFTGGVPTDDVNKIFNIVKDKMGKDFDKIDKAGAYSSIVNQGKNVVQLTQEQQQNEIMRNKIEDSTFRNNQFFAPLYGKPADFTRFGSDNALKLAEEHNITPTAFGDGYKLQGSSQDMTNFLINAAKKGYKMDVLARNFHIQDTDISKAEKELLKQKQLDREALMSAKYADMASLKQSMRASGIKNAEDVWKQIYQDASSDESKKSILTHRGDILDWASDPNNEEKYNKFAPFLGELAGKETTSQKINSKSVTSLRSQLVTLQKAWDAAPTKELAELIKDYKADLKEAEDKLNGKTSSEEKIDWGKLPQ